MLKLIDEYFLEWADKKDSLLDRISLFNHIRDMPYTMYRDYKTVDEWMIKVLETKRGSCNPKHFILAEMFKKLGLDINYVTCPMDWKTQKLDYPKHIFEIAAKIPTVYHLALQVKINDNWIFVDATYDMPLEKTGTYVTKNWDGNTDTGLAVDYLDTIIHKTKEERINYTNKMSASWTDEDRSNSGVFAKLMNEWFEEVRKNI